MEFMLDTANITEIKKYGAFLPLAGVTTNPSIIKKEGEMNFFKHMQEIRSLIGSERSLHIQVVAQDYEGMLEDAHAILENVDRDVFVKIPTTPEGLEAMKELKKQGVNVTATAIYSKFQAYLAIAAGADYIAPYFNRMENLNSDPREAIREMAAEIARTNSPTKILAASFKNVAQVTAACESGAQSATMGVDIIAAGTTLNSVQNAVETFTADWESVYGRGKRISDLCIYQWN